MAIVTAPIEIITPPKHYPPVGHCIYCGVYTKQLTKEHVIAYGLAGDSLILPKASCRACADETRKAETACLRHLWWPFRTRIGAPTRGKEAPEKFLVRQMKVRSVGADGNVDAYDKVAETPVDPAEFPFIFATYKFDFPGIITGRDPDSSVNYELVCRMIEDEVRKFMPSDKDGIRIAPVDVDAFTRMLSKIAHSYAVQNLDTGRSFRS